MTTKREALIAYVGSVMRPHLPEMTPELCMLAVGAVRNFDEAEAAHVKLISGVKRAPVMTDRQRRAWPEAVARAQKYILDYALPCSPDEWAICWLPEARTGRGHDLEALWASGDNAARIWLNVYGTASVSVYYADLIHADSWEECTCEYCKIDRGDEL